MILILDDEMYIDTDKISVLIPKDKFVVVDGCALSLTNEDHIDAMAKAFRWQHQGHSYNKELKRERGN